MKQLILFLAACSSLQATTKIRLHDSASTVSGYKTMDLQVGPSIVNSVTNTAGSGTDIQSTDTGGGTALKWISDPINIGFTLSGTVTCNIYGGESNASANAAFRCRIYKYSGGSEGSSILTAEMTTELNTTLTTARNWTGSPSSTVFAAGDRIVFKLFLENCATSSCPTGTMAGSQTVTAHYDGPTDAADGSSWVQTNETITFGDTTNVPTFVSWASYPNSANNGTAWGTCSGSSQCTYVMYLAEPTQAGQSIVLGGMWDNASTPTVTITDDQSNTWSTIQCSHVSGSANKEGIFYAKNVAAGTTKVTMTLNVGNGFIQTQMGVFYNAGDIDFCSANSSTGTSITAGSVTPSDTGDLVVQFMFGEIVPDLDGQSTSSITVGSQGSITWHLADADLYSAKGSQYGVFNATTALNPTFTMGTSLNWSSVAIFIKAAGSGSAPTQSFRRLHVGHQGMPGTSGNNHVNPYVMVFPSTGNLTVVAYEGSDTHATPITGITSTPSCTWNNTGSAAVNGHNAIQYWYATNCSSESLIINVTFTAADSDGTFLNMDFTGADSSPFVSDSGAQSGSAGNVATLTTCTACFTPGNTNGIVLAGAVWDNCTATAMTAPSGGSFDYSWYNGNNIDGPQQVDQNNGAGRFYNSNNNSITVTWTTSCGAASLLNWSGKVVSFKAASTATAVPRTLLLGVGDEQ